MSKEELGYVVWGAFALLIFIPELLALFGAKVIPWPGLVRTATNLEARMPWMAMVFLAGMAVLAVHIIFYPWPELPKD